MSDWINRESAILHCPNIAAKAIREIPSMTLEDLKKEASKLGYHLIPKKPKPIPKLPCICGRKTLKTWYSEISGTSVQKYYCPNCERETGWFKTESEAREAWNKMIEDEWGALYNTTDR